MKDDAELLGAHVAEKSAAAFAERLRWQQEQQSYQDTMSATTSASRAAALAEALKRPKDYEAQKASSGAK